MAAMQEILQNLPTKARSAASEERRPGARGATRRGPEIVVNDIDVTLVFTAPFAFALPQRLVDWLLDRFKVAETKVHVSTSRRPIEDRPKPAARRATGRKTAPRKPRQPVRPAA
jgi:hypothetical protein